MARRLLDHEALEIVKLGRLKTHTHRQIGEMFGVSRVMVSMILLGFRHSEVTGIAHVVKQKTLTDEVVLKIVKLGALKTHTHRQIGEMFGVSKNVVNKILLGFSYSAVTGIVYVKQNSNTLTEEVILGIAEAYKTGKFTDAQIARMFNTSEGSVYAIKSGKRHSLLTGITLKKQPVAIKELPLLPAKKVAVVKHTNVTTFNADERTAMNDRLNDPSNIFGIFQLSELTLSDQEEYERLTAKIIALNNQRIVLCDKAVGYLRQMEPRLLYDPLAKEKLSEIIKKAEQNLAIVEPYAKRVTGTTRC